MKGNVKKYKEPRKVRKGTSWHRVWNEALHFRRKNVLFGARLKNSPGICTGFFYDRISSEIWFKEHHEWFINVQDV